ncbi:Pvc16 family protein [Embleya hyalina]|uniref:Pvc16 N-terminal domain-containing protein n=1 Tax=Embleya hyalina TaxID=516124 RepID=A0A401Z4N0_9ACTN|nr:Pvc16 family protein [Embleya hyalina]GCE01803.1 hypothetical protein EHYA_09577 [Embleya hyalina]
MSDLPPPVTIDMVDFSLAYLMAGNPTLRGAELSLGAPDSSPPSRPLVNMFLYRIREDTRRRQAGVVHLNTREADHPRTVEPPRYAELGYMVSVASAQIDIDPMRLATLTGKDFRPLDSHAMFQGLLTELTTIDELPLYVPMEDRAAYRYGVSVPLRLNQPSEDARSAGELWSALNVPPRPFLDLAVTIPMLPDESRIATGTWVTAVEFGITSRDGILAPEKRTLTTERIPEPLLHEVVRDSENGRIRITIDGRLPDNAAGLRAWISRDDVHVSNMTISLSDKGDRRFVAVGVHPADNLEYTMHIVGVDETNSRSDRVYIGSEKILRVT